MTPVRFLLFLFGNGNLPEVAFSPKVPVFLVGRFMPFKSAHWIFLNRGNLWKKNVVRIAEDMMTSHEFASMAIVNIVQTLLSQGVVASFGREKKMENKEA